MTNYVNILGAIILSNVLVDSDAQASHSLAGSPGGQVGSSESGLGILSQLTGALGGGAGDLADIVERIKVGGGGTAGDVQLATQSGGNAGGNNGGIVGNLLLGPSSGQGLGLGSLLASAVSLHRPDQDTPITLTEAQNEQAKYLLEAMFNAARAQDRKSPIDIDLLSENYPSLTDDEMTFIRERATGVNSADLQIPAGMEQQTYILSALSLNMNSDGAVEYITQLTTALGISPEIQSQIHSELGMPLMERQTLGGSPF